MANYRSGRPVSRLQLEVSANKRYLQTRAGTPVLLRGYVAWSAIVAIQQTDALLFLDAMQAAGMNTVIANAIDIRWTPDPPKNAYGDAPFTGTVSGSPDLTTPNAAYWAHVDWFIAAAAARGIIVMLFPAYYGYIGGAFVEGWASVLSANGSTRCTNYGAWFGARYASSPNLIIANYGDGLPDSTGRALVKAIYDGIRSADYSGRLHTNHYSRGQNATEDLTVPPMINYAYSAGGSLPEAFGMVHQKVLEGWNYAPTQPVFLGEDYYDHRTAMGLPGGLTAQQLRQETWDALLSGGCGKYFGDEFTWSFGYEPTLPGGTNWRTYLNSTGLQHHAIACAAMAARPWWKLVPSTGTGLLTSGGGTTGTTTYKPRALASDGTFAGVSTPDGTTFTVNKALLSAPFTARWLDPTSGSLTTIGTSISNSGTQAYTTPGTNAAGDADWIWLAEVP